MLLLVCDLRQENTGQSSSQQGLCNVMKAGVLLVVRCVVGGIPAGR